MEYEDPEITFLPTGKVRVYIPWAGRAIDIDGRVDDDVLTSQIFAKKRTS